MKYVLLSFAFVPFFSFSQEKKMGIGIMVSPDYCSRTNIQMGSIEKAKPGLTVGGSFFYTVNSFIAIETGVFYANKGTQTDYQELFLGSQINPQTGFSGGTPFKIKFIYNYNYVDIPVKIGFKLFGEKVKFIVAGGLNTSFFLSEKTTSVKIENGRKSKTKQNVTSYYHHSPVIFSPMLGIATNIQLNEYTSLRIEPVYRFSVTPILKDGTSKFYSLGINLGITRSF